jgi:Holliday junction resolvase RusA-like endonuclease
MEPITFSVTGTPRPQPRPRLARGRVVSTADQNARRWISLVEASARSALAAKGQAPSPVDVTMRFRMPTPKAARHGSPHTFVPDADNLAKLALDAMVRVGLIPDDSSVSRLLVQKVWDKAGGADFVIGVDQSVAPAVPPVLPPAWVGGFGG